MKKRKFEDLLASVDEEQPQNSSRTVRAKATHTSQPSSSAVHMTRSVVNAVDSSDEDGPNYDDNTVRMRFKCHRAGQPAGSRESKKVGCPYVVDVERYVDDEGQVWAVITEQCGHMNHTPGDAEDKKYLPLGDDVEANIATVSCLGRKYLLMY